MNIDIDEYAEGAILLDGLEGAIIGIVEEFGNGKRILYSKRIILSLLQIRDGMTEQEAEEFYDFNILGWRTECSLFRLKCYPNKKE